MGSEAPVFHPLASLARPLFLLRASSRLGAVVVRLEGASATSHVACDLLSRSWPRCSSGGAHAVAQRSQRVAARRCAMTAPTAEDWSLDDWLWNESELVRAAVAGGAVRARLTPGAQVAQPVGAGARGAPQGPAKKGAVRKPRRLKAPSARLVCQVRGCGAALEALRPYNQRTRCAQQSKALAMYRDEAAVEHASRRGAAGCALRTCAPRRW